MPLTTQPQPPTVVRCPGLSSIPTFHGEEKAASTFKKGAFLIDDDAGLLTETTAPLSAAAVTGRTLGMALHDATGVTAADVPFVWLGPHTIIEVTLSDGTAGTATLAQTHKWKVYPLLKGTAYWYADAAAVSDTGGLLITGFKDPIGTVNARVLGVITNTVRGGANAASGII
jgi:hypothetical protein